MTPSVVAGETRPLPEPGQSLGVVPRPGEVGPGGLRLGGQGPRPLFPVTVVERDGGTLDTSVPEFSVISLNPVTSVSPLG